MRLILNILFACFSVSLAAQVGIDNPNPDSKAVLDVQSVTKGVLIPRLFNTERLALTIGNPEGLMVYDKDMHAFYYFYNGDWLCVTPWTLKHSTATLPQDMTLNTALASSVGINTTPTTTEVLAVGGSARTTDCTTAKAQVVVNGSLTNVYAGVFNESESNKTFHTDGIADNSGPVMPNSIIYWYTSGSISDYFDDTGKGFGALTGWAICNGNNGTPNLLNRFIVGADLSYSVGSTGGENSHTLLNTEMPEHTHLGTTSTNGNHNHTWQHGREGDDGDEGGSYDEFTFIGGSDSNVIADAGNHSHTFSTSYIGGNSAHENRPPYYGLLYIMKL